jgi:Polyketide cyclase / dehydrase and lipid transport
MATIRREVVIERPAAEVWEIVGRPELLHLWFPGIIDCAVDGASRVITTAGGLPIPEQIVTNDALQRRFQYRIIAPLFRHHLGTVDVIALDDKSCLVVYSTDADPDVMALIIGAAAGDALDELRRQCESGSGPAIDAVMLLGADCGRC